MSLNLQTPAILDKTRELCQTLAEQPEFQIAQQRIAAFLASDEAKGQYQLVARISQELHQKQHQGEFLSDKEIADFENHRNTLLSNPLARDFLEAQEQVQQVQNSISRHISRTIELGRVPTPNDFESCGSSCDCCH